MSSSTASRPRKPAARLPIAKGVDCNSPRHSPDIVAGNKTLKYEEFLTSRKATFRLRRLAPSVRAKQEYSLITISIDRGR